MIKGVDEVSVLLLVAFEYEYLLWEYNLTRFRSTVIIRDKIRSQKRHDKRRAAIQKNLANFER